MTSQPRPLDAAPGASDRERPDVDPAPSAVAAARAAASTAAADAQAVVPTGGPLLVAGSIATEFGGSIAGRFVRNLVGGLMR